MIRGLISSPINLQILDHPDGSTSVARTWRADDAMACTLCATCSATFSEDGETALCLIWSRRRVPPDQAAAFGVPHKGTPRIGVN